MHKDRTTASDAESSRRKSKTDTIARTRRSAPPSRQVSPKKGLRMTHATAAVESSAVEATTGQEIPSRVCENDINPIDYWIQRGYWPKNYFRQEGQQGISVCKGRSRHLLFTASNRNLARSPAPPHLVIKRQGTKKVLLYGNPLYQTILESKGSLMKEARGGITDESSTLIESSLAMAPTVPENSLFRDDLSDTTCEKVQRGNEARVIRDIGLLIVPSAAILDTYGATLPECLVESVNQGWNNRHPFLWPPSTT
ncbi:hypothetical protein ACO22_04433 [Paracoccidioides brasiliensis]|uniref:DUF7924 domain-containing protein n=1 Tax=Paracoccidioides brasiliensis TaxID=121759 RepID=A0A1D2JD35_PARBR|nr:hypothetical protein ACO22_04433 [Paracoccidioides brasiliensis]